MVEDWLGFWEAEDVGWKELVPRVPGPPQVEERLEGAPALVLPCTRDQRGDWASGSWETQLGDLGGGRVFLVTTCLVIIEEGA